MINSIVNHLNQLDEFRTIREVAELQLIVDSKSAITFPALCVIDLGDVGSLNHGASHQRVTTTVMVVIVNLYANNADGGKNSGVIRTQRMRVIESLNGWSPDPDTFTPLLFKSSNPIRVLADRIIYGVTFNTEYFMRNYQ